jgi:hypothetical protein
MALSLNLLVKKKAPTIPQGAADALHHSKNDKTIVKKIEPIGSEKILPGGFVIFLLP